MALCPECEAQLDLDDSQIDEGAVISCPDCGSDFEVVNAHPLELNAVDDDEDEDEDFDDEDGDEDFDDEDLDDEDDEDFDEYGDDDEDEDDE